MPTGPVAAPVASASCRAHLGRRRLNRISPAWLASLVFTLVCGQGVPNDLTRYRAR